MLIGRNKLIMIDEAQRIKNVGLTLKLLVDQFPSVQTVATGSSSLDLSNEISEPLTGRKYEFQLYPLSLLELTQKYSRLEIKRLLDRRMVMGMYPEIEEKPDEDKKLLRSLASDYLFKDVLQHQDIRKPELLQKLITALALQIGNEVSYNELSTMLSVNRQTIINYIQLLEKGFVVFRLPPFSRNLRNELTKKNKIYFYDTGIRNALINNFNSLGLRQDTGALWENFILCERIKRLSNAGIAVNRYFWRTHQGSEIDLIEEREGRLSGFEFKWKPTKWRPPKLFMDTYQHSRAELIHSENYEQFALDG
jgi:predicted AAA+ superfamily ATPase